MALINCPDCNRDISDAAPHCLGCGRPMAASLIKQSAVPAARHWADPPLPDIDYANTDSAEDATLTTQLTAKKLKAAMVVGAVLFWAGIITLFAGAITPGVILTAAGMMLYIGANISAWWNHG